MKFPIITDISQILDTVRGRDEFVVAEREGFTVIDYQVMMPDTFPPLTDEISALRRECRGIKLVCIPHDPAESSRFRICEGGTSAHPCQSI